MDQDNNAHPSQKQQYAAFVSWLAYLCQILETSVVVFTRSGFGRRYFGLQAFAVLPLLLLYTTFWPEHDPRPIFGYLGAYIVAVALARIGSVRRQRRGEVQHSQYSGTPSILRWPIFRRWLKESTAKGFVEPILVIAFGVGIARLHEPLAVYLVAAAFGQMIAFGIAQAYEDQRLMDMRDAYLEQQHLAERFRRGSR